jgi:hypothetical protein
MNNFVQQEWAANGIILHHPVKINHVLILQFQFVIRSHTAIIMERIARISFHAQVFHIIIRVHVIMYMAASIIQETLVLTFRAQIIVAIPRCALKIGNAFTKVDNVIRLGRALNIQTIALLDHIVR